MPDCQQTLPLAGAPELPLPEAAPARRRRVTPYGEACLAYMRALVAPNKKPRRRERGE